MNTTWDVSIIVPVRNQVAYLKQAVFSILANTAIPFELILVDDNSGRQVKSYLRHLSIDALVSDPKTQLCALSIYRQKHRKGFPATCNNGIAHATGRYICLLNTDTWVTPGWLTSMVQVGDELSRVGILGPSTCKGKQVLDYSHISRKSDYNGIGAFIKQKYAGQVRDMYLTGFCFMVKKEVFDKVGVFDERFGIGTGEEGEFTVRALDAGYRSVWVQEAYVHHFGGKTFKGENINAHRLRALTQKLSHAITNKRRGRPTAHDIDDLVHRIKRFER